MITKATDDQLKVIANICKKHVDVPAVDFTDDAAGQVFVSMPMNEQKCDCVAVIRDGIRTALTSTGNEPYFLDKDFHSENIYNVMLEHIHNCKFLVADLTTQNLGAYYEADYAKALGKAVIFTCKDSDFTNIRFDIKQVQTIIWHDESDLSEKLAEQICGLNLGKM